MFGISTTIWLAIAAALILVGGLVGFIVVLRRRTGGLRTSGRWYVRLFQRLFPAINPDDIGSPVDPFRTLRFFGIVVVIGLVIGLVNMVLTGVLWLSVAMCPVVIVAVIILSKLIGVIVSLEEGEAINVDRWGGYHHTLISFRGHVILNRAMVVQLNAAAIQKILKTTYMVGEIVNVGEMLTALRGGTGTAGIVAEFERFARSQERANGMFGGLRVVGWPWVDRIHLFDYPSTEVKTVDKDGLPRFQEAPIKRTGLSRLLLSDVTKSLLLQGIETAPLPDDDGGRKSGYGYLVNLLATPIVRVTHPYLAVYKTREGWAHILTNLLSPVVLEVVRKRLAEDVSENLTVISAEVLRKLARVNKTGGLRSRYGLELIRLPIQDTQMTKPADDTTLQLATAARYAGRARELQAEFEGRAIITTRRAEATGVRAMVEAARQDPITARLAISADAAKNAKGTVIMSMGSEGGKPPIDPGTQVLIERITSLTAALEKGQKQEAAKKKRADGEAAAEPATDKGEK